jgi:large repetitive protein
MNIPNSNCFRKPLLLLFLLMMGFTSVMAQEICNNGKDDDGDGFIDCFDSDCSANSLCDGNYFGNDIFCQAKPTAFPKFSMKLLWGSANKTTNHLNRASVGDLNRDGIPEVVVTEIENDFIYVLDGKTGTTKKSLKTGFSLDREIAIANINNTNCGQIFVSGGNNIYAYDCNLNLIWKSTTLNDSPAQFGIADFDGDGKAEIYCRDEILDAQTGIRIVKGTNTSNAAGQPVAVDILNNDNKLELVSGCNIYSVNLGARTLNSGSLTLVKNVPSFFIRKSHTSTSVADYNLDGNLDVIASGSDGSADANTTLFFWDVQNNVVKKYIDKIASTVFIAGCSNTSGTYYKNGWQNGTGRVNIADIDDDGKLNASYVSGKYLYALDENWNLKWRVVVNEETSGYTGSTVYDFNGDGAAEVVYRDEQFLYIINGKDGSINTQQQCIARTNVEYPIVADINGDGSTELCVTCGFDDKLAWSNFCNLSYSVNSHVRVFESASLPWVPSRKLWNQHAYFNVNVNDDLTIPKVVQKHHLIWSNGTCTQGPNRPLNTFLNQTPFLDTRGCPTYASPDLINVKTLFKVNQPTCPDKDFTVTMGVQNIGDVTMIGAVPVTFYKGDPRLAGAVKLNTVSVNVNLAKGQTQTFTNLNVTGTGGAFKLFISLNDAGTSVPTPIVLPNTSIIECSYDNVIDADILPKSVKVTALKVADNIKCLGATVPDNGAARAFVLVGGVENTVDYDFFWYNGTVAGAPNFTGVAYTALAAGTYKVFAKNKVLGCNSDTATVVINRVDKAPLTVAIVVDKANSSCGVPNGQFHAVVNGGDPIINYTFKWYEGNDIFTSPEIATGNIASNLKGGKTYTVLVTDNFSGCQVVSSLAVPDITVTPVASASTTNALCVPANSGSASATVGGITIGYTFSWYNGAAAKPTADFTGATYSSIPAGAYTVIATETASGCKSAPVTVNVNTPPPFTVTAAQLSPQTSCNPLTPNGSATADVGGVTVGFTFAWFKGQSTAPADAVTGPTNLAAGVYTVKATNTTTGCFATAEATITQTLVYPVVTLTPSPNAVCDPTKGTSAFTGSVTANVSYNGSTVTDFTPFQLVWHNGLLPTDPVIAGANSKNINQLNGGNYTLVVTKTTEGCAAAPATALVSNTPTLPTLITSQSPSHNCDAGPTGDGSAEVTKVNTVNVGATTNFTYQWHTGIGTTTVIAGQTNPKLQNLKGGVSSNFTVLVTDKTTGCQNTTTVLVGESKVLPVLTLKSTPNSICDAAKGFNGSALYLSNHSNTVLPRTL